MALSLTNAGVASAASGASPQAVTTAVAFVAGDILVAVMSYDNSGTSGADPVTGQMTVTPGAGAVDGTNLLASQTGLNDPGVASAGLAVRAVALQVTTDIPNGTSVNVAWTGTVVVRTVAFVKVSASIGLPVVRTTSGATGTNQVGTAAPALTTPSVNVDELCLCWAGHEYGEAIVDDADTTNGTWTAGYGTNSGSTTSGMGVAIQAKIQTTTASTQAYNPTGTSSDWVLGAIVFREVVVPTFVAEYHTATWTNAGNASLAVSGVVVQVGDIIVVGGMGEAGFNTDFDTCTDTDAGGTNTYTPKQHLSNASTALVEVWTATAKSTGTVTVTVHTTGSANNRGVTIQVWRNSDGVGVTNSAQTTGAPTMALVCRSSSGIAHVNADFAAVDGSSRTRRTVNGSTGVETVYDREPGSYTVYSGYYTDGGIAGSKTLGWSAPTGQTYTLVGVEVWGAPPSSAAAADPLIPDGFQDQYDRVNRLRAVYRATTLAAVVANDARRGGIAGDLIPTTVDAADPLVPDSFQDQFDRVNAQRTRYRTSSVAAAISANADRRGIIADTLYPNLVGSYITAASVARAGTIATTEAGVPLVPDDLQDQVERVRRLRVVYRSSALAAAIGANADRRGQIADVLYPNIVGSYVTAASVARAGTIATTEAGTPLVPDGFQDQYDRVNRLRTAYRTSTLTTVEANADRRGSVADVLYPNLTGSHIAATSQAYAGTIVNLATGPPLVPDGFQDQIQRVRRLRTAYRTTTVTTVGANFRRRGVIGDVLYPNLTGSYIAATSQAFAGTLTSSTAGVPLVPDGMQDQIERVRRLRAVYRTTTIVTVEANEARRGQIADVLHPNLVGSHITAVSVARAGSIRGTGVAALTGSHIATGSSAHPGTIHGSGTVSLAGHHIPAASVCRAGTIRGTGAAPLGGSHVAATSVCRSGSFHGAAALLGGFHIAATSVCRPGALRFSRPAVSEPVRLIHRDRSRLTHRDQSHLIHREQSRHSHREPSTRLVRREQSRLINLE